jgi:maltooligosyltrehalose trehalohydrolase
MIVLILTTYMLMDLVTDFFCQTSYYCSRNRSKKYRAAAFGRRFLERGRLYNENMAAGNVKISRRLPIGAEVLSDGRTHFRVWAPQVERVEVVFGKEFSPNKACHNRRPSEAGWNTSSLVPESNGYFSGTIQDTKEGTLYYYRLDNADDLYPDPASRFQPDGPEGPSQVINPARFAWTDENWKGLVLEGQVIYEMHVGTFSQSGSWKGAIERIPALADTGITVIEVMPVADFAGDFGWGYDGVDLFAPTRLYGTPDEYRLFIDKAHSLGIGVILDVVYNHLGPVGNYLGQYTRFYFSDSYKNEWGEAINFDGPNSGPVREFFIANAGYWVEEFHLDGLRLDASHQIFDKSPENILAAITRRVREAGGRQGCRKTILIAENETQQVKLGRPIDEGGYGMDALWNDDFHHSAMVALTGHNEAYYTDYLGNPQEFISSLKWGYLFQGQYYKWQKHRRGSPGLGLKPSSFILYIQNHDQIANTCCGIRVHKLTSPGLLRAITALLLLAPGTPMLFQGQEFAASTPFFYFSNVSPALVDNIHRSRLKFLSQFRNLAQPEIQATIPRPDDPDTFERSKLDFTERELHREIYQLHCDLLKLRREDRVFHSQRKGMLDGAVISPQAFILRFFGDKGDDRLMLVNLGTDLQLGPAPEPLLAPPEGAEWKILWSSEAREYGGLGVPPLETGDNWRIPGRATVVMKGEKG